MDKLNPTEILGTIAILVRSIIELAELIERVDIAEPAQQILTTAGFPRYEGRVRAKVAEIRDRFGASDSGFPFDFDGSEDTTASEDRD